MAISKEIEEYFTTLVAPLATSNELNKVLKEFKNEIIAKFESRFAAQEAKIEKLESQVNVQANVIHKLKTRMRQFTTIWASELGPCLWLRIKRK